MRHPVAAHSFSFTFFRPFLFSQPFVLMTTYELFKGGGEMGQRIRDLDWSQTLLGPVNTWPQSLITAVTIMLGSRFPMMVHWGPELVHFYNDGYAAILQNKHPGALGQPAEPWWPEMWPFLLDIFRPVLAGETTYFENSLVLPNRRGFVEEAYFTFSHSPIYSEDGAVGGIFVTALETTETVVQQRRLALLSHLTTQTALAGQPAEVAQHIIAALATNLDDVPFALLYAHEPPAARAQLRAWFGLPAGEPTAPATLPVDPVAASPVEWPLAEVLRRGSPLLVEDLPGRFAGAWPLGAWPLGAWPETPTQALLLPLPLVPTGPAVYLLIVGLSPRRPLNEAYQNFLALVADYAGRALARATAQHAALQLNQDLREANASLDTFVHIVAHDLRQPTNNLRSLLEAYREEAPGPGRDHLVALMETEAQGLASTTQGLLHLLETQHGAAAETDPVPLADVYVTVQAEVAALLHQHQGRLTADFTAAPTVRYPRAYLESILKNLVSNALKYRAPDRAPLIRVQSQRRDAGVVLTVADNGRGIDLAQDGERLFQPFTRLVADSVGVGLGLHIIQALVQQRGGSLGVRSSLGVGTTFEVVLPE
jgi:signal transduction histidine kinase